MKSRRQTCQVTDIICPKQHEVSQFEQENGDARAHNSLPGNVQENGIKPLMLHQVQQIEILKTIHIRKKALDLFIYFFHQDHIHIYIYGSKLRS